MKIYPHKIDLLNTLVQLSALSVLPVLILENILNANKKTYFRVRFFYVHSILVRNVI